MNQGCDLKLLAILYLNVIFSSLLTRYKCGYFGKMDATNIFIVDYV